jgi:hypothetical protein
MAYQSKNKMKRFWVLALLMLVSATGCKRSSNATAAQNVADTEQIAWDFSSQPQVVAERSSHASSRPIYPFSLVAGGVYTAKDLARAIAVNDGLRLHYANFDFSHVRLIRMQANTQAYVSYKNKGRIFWSKRPVTLEAGELVLADGHYLVRARCANQISFFPQTPVELTDSAVEDQLDVPATPVPMDYSKLQQVNSPLLPMIPPIEESAPNSLLAKSYLPPPESPTLRLTPVCNDCGQSHPPVTTSKPPQGTVAMPDADNLTMIVVGLLLMASLVILKKQRKA